MSKINLLKKINSAINPDGTQVDFKLFDAEVQKLKNSLKEKIQIHTLDDVKMELEKFKAKLDTKPLLRALSETEQGIKENIKEKLNNLSVQLNSKIAEYKIIEDKKEEAKMAELSIEISDIKSQIYTLNNEKNEDIKYLKDKLSEINLISDKLDLNIKKANKDITDIKTTFKDENKSITDKFVAISNLLDESNITFRQKLNELSQRGGGAMNRQMFIGDVDPLTRYTDMNLKAGSNVTITYANNNTTKKVDVTFASTGSGGSVRSINSVAVSTLAGSTSGTDYVYLCTGTLTLTMPTAVGNTNLYTIKNVGSGIVTVAYDGIETCDGSTTTVMPVQYTAIDIISDTVNWNIT